MKRESTGFTLVEVVVALAILGTGLVVLLETHFAALNLFADAQEAATLRLLTDRAVGDAEVGIFAGELTGEGDFGTRYPEYAYSYSGEFVSELDMPGLIRVTVNVSGPTESAEEIQFLTYDSTQVQSEADNSNRGIVNAKPSKTPDAK